MTLLIVTVLIFAALAAAIITLAERRFFPRPDPRKEQEEIRREVRKHDPGGGF